MNKMLGMIGLTVGGGLIGAGVERGYIITQRVGSKITKALGQGIKFDQTTWVLLICGLVILVFGVYFASKRK